jgi:hypothetical protein
VREVRRVDPSFVPVIHGDNISPSIVSH